MVDSITEVTPQILSRLKCAAANALSAEHALGALAQVDPAEAAGWLLAEEHVARASFSAATLSWLLDVIVTAGLARSRISRKGEFVAVARRYADVVRPDTAAAAAWAVPPVERSDDVRELVAAVLKREPKHGKLLRVASEMAVSGGDGPKAHQLLTQLAQADDSQATVHYVYRTRAGLPPAEGPLVRAALVSSFTVDALVFYADLEFRALGLAPKLYVAPFNSWVQEIIGEDSGLRRFKPEITFLAISIDDLVPELAGSPSVSHLDDAGNAAVDRVLDVARRFTGWSDGTLVVHNFYSAYRSPLGILKGRAPGARISWLATLNARLADGLHELPCTYLLDMNEVLLYRSGGAFDNPKMRYLGRMRLGDRALPEVARAYARYVAPLKGLTRKCVVVDLDNTLWGGIVGEDSLLGIKLGNTSPGIEYQDFQRYLLSLTKRGFLLAINSKNNPEDALAVIRSHEGMILREDVFSAIRINWRPKTENMISIAEELNLGMDSMIFLDDNPHERELMRQILPQVLSPDLPADPSLYRQTVEMLPQLQTLVLTDEDRTRTEQYRAKRQRDRVRVMAHSLEEYLHSLDIAVDIRQASDTMLPRVHQLFERTNQFNLTARRYEPGQLAAFAHDPGWRLYAVRARDRFGDHGIVATALVRAEADHWTVDSFLMSCRVIGYGLETAFLATVSADARAAGVAKIIGEYIETKKNSPAGDFYPRHGFTVEEKAAGITRWGRMFSNSTVVHPTWIKMEVPDGA